MNLIEKTSREHFSKSFTSLSNEVFDNDYIETLGSTGKNPRVETCSFRSTVFVRCYFRNVTFVGCNFTAAKFIDCNFKESKFIDCVFNYSMFRRTIIDAKEIIPNLPREPNIQRDLLRNLRVDARELGNAEDESFYIRKEIAASEKFHLSAFLGKDRFYREKYGHIERLGFFLQWCISKISGLVWGNGERPGRIAAFCLLLIIAMSAFIFLYNGNSTELLTSGNATPVLLQALKLSTSEFLGIPYEATDYTLKIPFLFSVAAISLRYVIIGLLVSVFFRVFSRR
ncbi:TPA: pentapeptide repeat-containing protein [Pseudomonas aeruginosa]|nr:pentapeptide repeat-containing protein [Pseudomonas aeruginosa]HDP3471518.1 pentapeptide repeat-containing protein [Pseudomonas aeruginosa]